MSCRYAMVAASPKLLAPDNRIWRMRRAVCVGAVRFWEIVNSKLVTVLGARQTSTALPRDVSLGSHPAGSDRRLNVRFPFMATEIGLTEIYLRETFPSSPMIGCSWDIPNVWQRSRRDAALKLLGQPGGSWRDRHVGRCPEGPRATRRSRLPEPPSGSRP